MKYFNILENMFVTEKKNRQLLIPIVSLLQVSKRSKVWTRDKKTISFESTCTKNIFNPFLFSIGGSH